MKAKQIEEFLILTNTPPAQVVTFADLAELAARHERAEDPEAQAAAAAAAKAERERRAAALRAELAALDAAGA
jgi:hypothetical protein